MMATVADGLSAAEVDERRARGLVNDVPRGPQRTVADIVRGNVLTYFNALLGSMFVVILLVAPVQDALFGGVLVANTLIGIVQELRAKRTLDRLSLLSAPRARVVRDGEVAEVDVGEVVLDDLLVLAPGDQVVVDGEVVEADGLEVDESLLTGEAELVGKEPGESVLSGSFVAVGGGRYRATKVGAEAYAVRLAEEARRFTLVRSELRQGVDRILRGVTFVLVPTAVLLTVSQLSAHEDRDHAITSAIAGVVAMVPEGLVLLTSLAFAVGVVRLGRRNVLVQELPSVEVLARVDVLCLDKTGTLTEGRFALREVQALDGDDAVARDALAALVQQDSHPNPSLLAIATALPSAPGWEAVGHVPFSSARKWSAVSFADHGHWVLGAPEVLLAVAGTGGNGASAVPAEVERHASEGRRVLLLARSAEEPTAQGLPLGLRPAALVVLEELIRSDAAATVAWFAAQGVTVKVLSGDHAATVAAVSRRVGVKGADAPRDARQLPDDRAELAEVLERTHVFGRVTPHQKRAMVAALQSTGHVVAMTGDGVNDVLALKDSDIGIAMGSGSPATRAVAQLVLLDGRFATMPEALAEGRRVIANIERVARLFVTKTVYAALLALAVGVAGFEFPFLPRHLTLVGSLTIGIPGFFLALAPNAPRARSGFVGRVVRFCIPAGLVAGGATFASFWLAREQVPLVEARSTATLVLLAVGLWILSVSARPLTHLRRMLLLVMGGAFALVLVVPGLRRFFDLRLPQWEVWIEGAAIAGLAAFVIESAWQWSRRRQGMLLGAD